MNIPGYILAIYMLLLAIVPCCAFDDCPDDGPLTEQRDEHQSGDGDCGNCSPFFNCEGCSSATVAAPILTFTLAPLLVQRSYSAFISSPIPEVHYDFWQPPQLG